MQLTNRDVFLAREPLQGLLAAKWPVKTAFALAKLGVKINEPLQVIEQVRRGLIEKYVPKDERGRPKSVKNDQGDMVFDLTPEAETKLNQEFNELLDQTVELVFEKVKLPDGNGSAGVDITPATLMALLKFLEA